MGFHGRVLASVWAMALAACSSPVPTSEPSAAPDVLTDVTVPLGRAPGRCGEVTKFAYVAVTTLRALGFEDQRDDPDFNRRGRFWVTADELDIPVPPGPPRRPPARMLCVEWADGNPIGMVTQALPDDWSPPSD